MKKIISLLLVLLIFSPVIAQSVSAQETEPTSGVPFQSSYEWEQLKLTNKLRASLGIAPLSTFESLQTVADVRKKEIETLFSHSRPDGSDCYSAYTQSGIANYSTLGENIAAGFFSPESVTEGWKNSPGHYGNMIDSNYTHLGVGQSGYYWTQNFLGFYRCKLSNLSVTAPTTPILNADKQIDDLNLTLTVNCSEHGKCYLPIIEEMCSGIDRTKSGEQTINVNYQGNSIPLKINMQIPTPLKITTLDLPNGSENNSYSFLLEAESSPANVTEWKITNGALPNGLNLDETTGLIYGTPTQNGTFNFTVQVKNSADESSSADLSLIIDSAKLSGDVNGDGVVTVTDVTTIQKYLAKLTTFDAEETILADYNNDGNVTIYDVTAIQRMLAGIGE